MQSPTLGTFTRKNWFGYTRNHERDVYPDSPKYCQVGSESRQQRQWTHSGVENGLVFQ
jgi:hypothetical protein